MIKIKRVPIRHDNIDFRPLIAKTSEILPLSVVLRIRDMIVTSRTSKRRTRWV